MPWSEIESKENQEKIKTMRSLITLRKKEKMCRSPYFHFTHKYGNKRLLEYVKIDEEGNKIEVLLNTSDTDVKINEGGEILFSQKFNGSILGVNGTLIRKI